MVVFWMDSTIVLKSKYLNILIVQVYRNAFKIVRLEIYVLADSGFFKNLLYQGGVKSTVSWVFEDLKFKISEGYDQNWCFPESAQLAVSV